MRPEAVGPHSVRLLACVLSEERWNYFKVCFLSNVLFFLHRPPPTGFVCGRWTPPVSADCTASTEILKEMRFLSCAPEWCRSPGTGAAVCASLLQASWLPRCTSASGSFTRFVRAPGRNGCAPHGCWPYPVCVAVAAASQRGCVCVCVRAHVFLHMHDGR